MRNVRLRLMLLVYASARAATEQHLPSMNSLDALTTPQRLTRRTHNPTHSQPYAASPVLDHDLPSPQSSARSPTWAALQKQITSAGEFSPFEEAALSDGVTPHSEAQHEKGIVRRVARSAEADAVAIDGAGVIAPADKEMPSSGLAARPSQSLAQVQQLDAANLSTTALAETPVVAASPVAVPDMATLTSTVLTAKLAPVAALAPTAQVAAVAAVPAAPVPAATVAPAAVAPTAPAAAAPVVAAPVATAPVAAAAAESDGGSLANSDVKVVPAAIASVAPAAAAPVAAAPVATAPVAAVPAESSGGFGIGAVLAILLFIGMLSVVGVLALKWHSRRREAGRLAALATSVRKQSVDSNGGSYRKSAMNLPTNDSESDNGSGSKGLSSPRPSGASGADSKASSASMPLDMKTAASYRDRRLLQKKPKGSKGSASVPLSDATKLLEAEDDEEDIAL